MGETMPVSSLRFFASVTLSIKQGEGCDQHPKNTIISGQAGKEH